MKRFALALALLALPLTVSAANLDQSSAAGLAANPLQSSPTVIDRKKKCHRHCNFYLGGKCREWETVCDW
jgi:hypothetical protein